MLESGGAWTQGLVSVREERRHRRAHTEQTGRVEDGAHTPAHEREAADAGAGEGRLSPRASGGPTLDVASGLRNLGKQHPSPGGPL